MTIIMIIVCMWTLMSTSSWPCSTIQSHFISDLGKELSYMPGNDTNTLGWQLTSDPMWEYDQMVYDSLLRRLPLEGAEHCAEDLLL
jgi:hypothetical protein